MYTQYKNHYELGCFCTKSLRSGMWPMLVPFHQHMSRWSSSQQPPAAGGSRVAQCRPRGPECPLPLCTVPSVLPEPASSPLERLSPSAWDHVCPHHAVLLSGTGMSCSACVLLLPAGMAPDTGSGYTMNTHLSS